ncbi:MAG: Oxidoreductase, FAD-dependent [Phycisphaerales bacterium]|nr:Oxidoreductase, FAD-dependent [Phycisphaerales bacterium]
MKPVDVLIVGAGIVGAACADALTRDGLSVALVDRAGVADGATGAAMGHVVAMPEGDAIYALTRYSQKLWAELKEQLPAAVEYRTAGTLWIAADDHEMSEVQRMHGAHAQAGFAADILSGGDLARMEPNLRPGFAGALHVPGDVLISPTAAATYLVDRARSRGAQVCEGVTVTEFIEQGARLASGEIWRAKFCVNACGALAPRLTPGLLVRPRKGHLVMVRAVPGFATHQLVELGYLKSVGGGDADSVAFNLHPRADGTLLIGSSRQYDNASPDVEPAMLARMLERAYQYMPALARLEQAKAWAGFRAATPDKLPLIGPSPPRPDVFLATGHEGLGITTSLATGQIIADLILNKTPAIDCTPFSPARFI